MRALAIDTHRIVKRLVDSGFSTDQAESVTDIVLEVREVDLDRLATKEDLARLETNLRSEIAELGAGLRAEILGARHETRDQGSALRTDMAMLRSDTAKWIIGAVLFNIVTVLGAIFGFAKLLGH